MGVSSPFVGQKLVNHRFGRHNIGGYNCTVYYSEFLCGMEKQMRTQEWL